MNDQNKSQDHVSPQKPGEYSRVHIHTIDDDPPDKDHLK